MSVAEFKPVSELTKRELDEIVIRAPVNWLERTPREIDAWREIWRRQEQDDADCGPWPQIMEDGAVDDLLHRCERCGVEGKRGLNHVCLPQVRRV